MHIHCIIVYDSSTAKYTCWQLVQCDKESGLKQLSWCTNAFTAWLHHTWHHIANQHHHATCPSQSHLRSATSGKLNFPCTKTDYGKRSFAVNGPVVWNSLPTELQSPDIAVDVFKAKLKTFLFNCWLSAFSVFILILHLANDLNNNNKSSATA